jgi:hypothetical protein
VTLASTALALLILAAPAPAPVGGVSPVPGVRMDTSGPPPASLADPRVPQPSAASVWIDGHWQWAAGRWSWVAGQWATPPGRPPYVWVAARWVGDDRGFTFHEPFWRPSSSSAAAIHVPPFVPLTASPATPPPLLVETPVGRPSREAVWIPGFWTWTGRRYVWASGSWSAPYPGHSWTEGHWRRSGNGFTWTPGLWRRS